MCRGLGPGFNFGRSCLNTASLYDPEFLTSALRTLYETLILGLFKDVRAPPRCWTSPPSGECLCIYKHPCADRVSASYRSCQYTCGILARQGFLHDDVLVKQSTLLGCHFLCHPNPPCPGSRSNGDSRFGRRRRNCNPC